MNMKNFLAVAVIFLLIGLSVAPSINANISKEALVEFTTEVCGLNGGKQTVKLSHKEAEEVEALFDSIRIRLNETDSREEAEEIFKEAVVELDKYGLLGGLSVNQAQRLLSNNFRYLRLLKHIRNDLGNPQKNNSEINNMFCLVAGKTTETISKSIGYSVCKGIGVIGVLLLVAGFSEMWYGNYERGQILSSLGLLIFIPILVILRIYALIMMLNPIEIFHFVRIGELPTSAQGWVFTNGLFGVQEINGSFYGQISSPLFLTYNLGIVGFIGLAIMTDWNTLSWYYLGTSLKVSIGTEYQEP